VDNVQNIREASNEDDTVLVWFMFNQLLPLILAGYYKITGKTVNQLKIGTELVCEM
jgi:hypothetical protein